MTVCWKAPLTYTDGTTLTDLTGFRIEFGVGNFSRAFTVNRASATCQLMPGLAPGKWQFRVIAISSGHGESDPSATATYTVLPPATQGSIEDAGRSRVIPPKK